MLMCKGADNVMLPRLRMDSKSQQFITKVQRELLNFAK